MKAQSVMKDIVQNFKVDAVKRFKYLAFNLCDFSFFKDSEHGGALPFRSPRLVASLVAVPYVLLAEVIFFRTQRYFIKSEKQAVGIVAFHEKHEALYVDTVAVAPQYRRHGIATHILEFAEESARTLHKRWLELSVLRSNVPALRLYVKLGFVRVRQKKWSIIMRKSI